MNFLRRHRYDYLLIWGHGLKYREEILGILEETPQIDLLKIYSHSPPTVQSLVDYIYSHDYAPIQHLREKVNYLLSTPNQVQFIFFRNRDDRVDYYGEGAFRHEESLLIRELKNKIRDQFNPKKADGTRSENHVIHASDSTDQTHLALLYLGVKDGVQSLDQQHHLLGIPSHVPYPPNYRIELIPLSSLHANLNFLENGVVVQRRVNLTETPHFRGLKEDLKIYRKYLENFQGVQLDDYYSVRKFTQLSKTLPDPISTEMISVRKRDGLWVIQDGLHRAAIFQSRGLEKIPAIIIE